MNQKLFLLVISEILLLATLVNAGIVYDTLREGSSKIYSIDGKEYKVEVSITENTDPKSVNLKLNGEISNQLTDMDTARFSNGELITLLFLWDNPLALEAGGGDVIKFLLDTGKKDSKLSISKIKLLPAAIECRDSMLKLTFTISNEGGNAGNVTVRIEGTTLKLEKSESLVIPENTFQDIVFTIDIPKNLKVGSHSITINVLEEKNYLSKIITIDNVCAHEGSINNDEYDLSNFPKPFVFNKIAPPLVLVAGESAPSSDVLALTDIATALQSLAGVKNLGDSLLDSELINDKKLLDSYNIVAVGNPCENKVVEEFTSYNCENLYKLGKYAAIELKQNGEKLTLLVTAEDPEVRRNSSKIFVKMDKSNLKGKREVFIHGVEENPEILFELPIIKIPAQQTGEEKLPEVIKEVREDKSDAPQKKQITENIKQKQDVKIGFFRRILNWFSRLF